MKVIFLLVTLKSWYNLGIRLACVVCAIKEMIKDFIWFDYITLQSARNLYEFLDNFMLKILKWFLLQSCWEWCLVHPGIFLTIIELGTNLYKFIIKSATVRQILVYV